jgi:hypothetical protein
VLLPRLDDRDRVLGHGEAVLHCTLSQRDVVISRTGEVLQEVSVRLRRDDAEVEAQALVRQDGGLRRPLGNDLDHPLEVREVVDQRVRLCRRRDDVEVAEGLLAATCASRLGHVHGGRMLA